jgi:hypothetical protein
VILAAALFAAGVAQQPPATRIACEGRTYEVLPANSHRFVAIDHAALRRAFRGVKPVVIDGMRFLIAAENEPQREDADLYTARVKLAIEYGNGKSYRLVDEDGTWPEAERAYASMEARPRVRRVSRGVFRLDYDESTPGPRSRSTTQSTVVILTADPPRVGGSIDCTDLDILGCMPPPENETVDCEWSAALQDFICTATRESDWSWNTRSAQRRFSLLTAKELLPLKTGIPSYGTLEDLAKTLWQPMRPPDRRAIVQGADLLQHVDTGVIRGNTELYAAPGLTDDMALRLWAFTRSGKIIEVPMETVGDNRDVMTLAAYPRPPATAKEKDRYTPDGEQWSLDFGDRIGNESLLVLHDGYGRGLFWFSFDDRVDPPAIGLVRLATDSLVYMDCGRLLAPSSASLITATQEGLDAIIEAHSWRDQEGNYLEPIPGEDAIPPCRVRARLTWNRDEGFREQITDEVPCKPGELPRAVVIDQNGALLTRALKPSTER